MGYNNFQEPMLLLTMRVDVGHIDLNFLEIQYECLFYFCATFYVRCWLKVFKEDKWMTWGRGPT
jgi:hypothetical protein